VAPPRQHRRLLDLGDDLPRPPRPRPQHSERSRGLAGARGPVPGQRRGPGSTARHELSHLRPGRPLRQRVLLPDEGHGGLPGRPRLAHGGPVSWSSTFSTGSVTATPTTGCGSPASGPSPPSCRSVTTLSWRSLLRASSLGPPPPRGPRPPRLLSLPLLRPVQPRHHSRHFSVLFPPGRAGVGAVAGDVEQVMGATRHRHLHAVHPDQPSTYAARIRIHVSVSAGYGYADTSFFKNPDTRIRFIIFFTK